MPKNVSKKELGHIMKSLKAKHPKKPWPEIMKLAWKEIKKK